MYKYNRTQLEHSVQIWQNTEHNVQICIVYKYKVYIAYSVQKELWILCYSEPKELDILFPRCGYVCTCIIYFNPLYLILRVKAFEHDEGIQDPIVQGWKDSSVKFIGGK